MMRGLDSTTAGIWTTLGATLLGTGLAVLFFGESVLAGIVCLVLGGIIFLLLLVHPLRRMAAKPIENYKRRRQHRINTRARYLQTLRCSNGHVFREEVRFHPHGWLAEGGVRRCPECGDAAGGFVGLNAIPLNKEAKKRGSL